MKPAFLIAFVFLLSLDVSKTLGLDSVLEEEWMGVYSGDSRVGYSHTYIKPEGKKRRVFEETNLRMAVLGADMDVKVKSSYVLSGWRIEAFDFSMKSGSIDLSATGKREGNELKIRVSSVSGTNEISFPLEGEPLVSPVLYRWLSEKNPQIGKTYEITLFDPLSVLTGASASGLKATLSVDGEEEVRIPLGVFKTRRVKMTFAGSQITAWITERGETIKEVSPPGLLTVRESEDSVLRGSLSGLDIMGKTAISSDAILKNARSLRLLRLRVQGIGSTEGLDLGDDDRQSYKDGFIEVRVGDISKVNSYSIPYSDEGYRPYMKPGVLIQSDDPRIIEKAREIVGGERDSLKVARKISDWVYRNLEKTPTISLPNALDVLQTKKGDCNEHAVLFAALSRSIGIPTKIVLGVVFLDGKFYYHAWNEVFVGDWIAVDPTFGQFPADASHVKFVEGDLSRGMEIIRLVGNIKLEIEEAS